MRLITVTRVRNEEDIIEAFVRHHLRVADHTVVLDDGSNDRTPEILSALRSEGLPLTLLRARSVGFAESSHNTALLRRAALLAADWVLCLDCDEFIDESALGAPLRDVLAAVPIENLAISAELVQYHPTSADDQSDIIVPRRIRYRTPDPSHIFKVFVRGYLARMGGEIAHGNHAALLQGAPLPAPPVPRLQLAHFPVRSGWQLLAKALVGRLKVLASARTDVEPVTAIHYAKLLGNLWENPQWLLLDKDFLDGTPPPRHVQGGVIEAPMTYLGGELRYTRSSDPRVHAARSIVAYTELLATRRRQALDLNSKTYESEQAADSEIFEI